MPDLETEVAAGHLITGNTVGGTMRYWCSCGEIEGVDTDVAQDHVEEFTP